jgi:hypothetical protein
MVITCNQIGQRRIAVEAGTLMVKHVKTEGPGLITDSFVGHGRPLRIIDSNFKPREGVTIE